MPFLRIFRCKTKSNLRVFVIRAPASLDDIFSEPGGKKVKIHTELFLWRGFIPPRGLQRTATKYSRVVSNIDRTKQSIAKCFKGWKNITPDGSRSIGQLWESSFPPKLACQDLAHIASNILKTTLLLVHQHTTYTPWQEKNLYLQPQRPPLARLLLSQEVPDAPHYST